ncbi:hypothetical protein FIBSPDRAFT_727301, partial [Athelia psychrophila]
GCEGLAVTCYAGAGFVMGVTIVGSPPAISAACNVGLGACMATYLCNRGALCPDPMSIVGKWLCFLPDAF